MTASKLNLIFSMILSLQLCGTILLCNGMSMTLHTKRSMTEGAERRRKWGDPPLYYPNNLTEYYMKISVGTPLQDLLVVMDTGSNVVWVPCTSNYTCPDCSGYITVFLPNKSSSAIPVECADPKCKKVCEEEGSEGTCTETCSGTCPDYTLGYGSGSTTGHLLTDTLTLQTGSGQITNFAFGCSVTSVGFAGIAGFGRGSLSLPSQLSALVGDKFAYCLNDKNNGSMIVLGHNAVPIDTSLKYTPFLNKSQALSSYAGYNELYYIGLQGVSVGNVSLTMPSNVSTFDSNGNGGTIIDSGTTYSIFPQGVYDQIAAVYAFLNCSPRAPEVEATTGFKFCYNVSGVAQGLCSNPNILFPEISFHFSGGSDMVLPEENCFVPVTSQAQCLAFFGAGPESAGPAAILGNYQQRNAYILYDREMNSLGFTKKTCWRFF